MLPKDCWIYLICPLDEKQMKWLWESEIAWNSYWEMDCFVLIDHLEEEINCIDWIIKEAKENWRDKDQDRVPVFFKKILAKAKNIDWCAFILFHEK